MFEIIKQESSIAPVLNDKPKILKKPFPINNFIELDKKLERNIENE